MKHLFFIIVGIITTVASRAQDFPSKNDLENIDSIQLHVSYEVNFLCDYPNAYRKTAWREKDIMHLEIGKKNIAHSYMEKERIEDIRQTKAFKKKGIRTTRINLYAYLGETYLNYPKANLLTCIRNIDVAGTFLYQEDLPDFKWEITNEEKEIMGYRCNSATCSFRGREYTAWFTQEIPLSFGPWKFGGLPGLILEIEDSKNEFHFIINGIEKDKPNEYITFWKRDYIKATRKRCLKLEAMLHKDHGAFTADYGLHFNMQGLEHTPMPYHPIELK